ncbi:hypothetical protein [Embleya sp. NBC_00896]|uniref:hypothetical protein n=1 Tax=Embleya sp. NBC_00896 TaxID=2975961 RepID=UPI002F90AE68|nr:hypothetical protein OG928_47030 [Embleya sp. NBC_00896]
MSLTGELKHTDSEVARFFAARLPDAARAQAALRRWTAHLPEPIRPPPGCTTPPWALGLTIDHRVRVSLGAPYGDPIRFGIKRFRPDDPGVRDAIGRAGAELLTELDRFTGAPLLLDGADGDRLIRLCAVASYFEHVYRSGGCDRGDLLDRAGAHTTLSSLLADVPHETVEDITAQLRLAEPREALGWLVGREVECGAVFAGSAHVGGADADLVCAGELIDCKATVAPSRLGTRELYQLAGYLLLDFDDHHRIRFVSLYLSRQGAMLGWHVNEFLPLLGATASLCDLRTALQDLLVPSAEHVAVGPDPAWAVPCPKCRAQGENGCVTPRGIPARATHAQRLNAVQR